MTSCNLAFQLHASNSWQGGFNYQLSVISSLTEFYSDSVSITVFASNDHPPGDLEAIQAFPQAFLIVDNIFSRKFTFFRSFISLILGFDPWLRPYIYKYSLTTIFESAQFVGSNPLVERVLAWIPDLQHRTLPSNFSFLAWLRRDLGFRLQATSNRFLIFSSSASRAQFSTYYSAYSPSCAVVNFPPIITRTDLDASCSVDVLSVYSISRPYIFLPNQFWLHKNHLTVLSALAYLPSAERPLIVATGSTIDYRRSDYFSLVKHRVVSMGLCEDFLILGSVPRSHFLALMSSASAFLNPSRSEGWNTSVEEAKLFALPLLLSDISVHREQANSDSSFFHPDDHVGLSVLLQASFRDVSGFGVHRFCHSEYIDRRRDFAGKLFSLISGCSDHQS